MSIRLENVAFLLDMFMHLSQCLLQDVSDGGLDADRILFDLIHLVLNVHQLLLNRPLLLIQLNVVFHRIIVSIRVSLLNGDQ
jgi:hypothetical protein